MARAVPMLNHMKSAAAIALITSFWIGGAAGGERILRVGITSGIAAAEPANKHDEATAAFLHQFLESLVAYREDMTVGPLLAERIDISNDGKIYTFTLREKLQFHNAAPVTSAEVRWSWERYLSRDWGTGCRGMFDGSGPTYLRPSHVLKIETPDVRTVIFHLDSPNGLFLHHMASHYCVTGILHPQSVDSNGSMQRPIATGPFLVESWEKGGGAVLRRFAAYNPRRDPMNGLTGAKRVAVDSLHFVAIKGRSEARQALSERRIDVLLDLSMQDYDALQGHREVILFTQQRLAWHQMLIQTRTDSLLRDKRIRQAIAHAIDSAEVARVLTRGLAQPNPSAVALASPYHTAVHDSSQSFDPAKSRALLREAGYSGEQIVIHASKDPHPVYYESKAPIYYETAVLVARMLNAAGINAVVEEVSWQHQDDLYNENRYQLMPMIYSMRTDPALMYSAYVGQKMDHGWYQWEDLEADLWTARAAQISDRSQRQALFDRIHAKMIDDVPSVGLFNSLRIDAVSGRVAGYRTFAMAIPRFWGVSIHGTMRTAVAPSPGPAG